MSTGATIAICAVILIAAVEFLVINILLRRVRTETRYADEQAEMAAHRHLCIAYFAEALKTARRHRKIVRMQRDAARRSLDAAGEEALDVRRREAVLKEDKAKFHATLGKVKQMLSEIYARVEMEDQ
jgi:uncharacterized protein (DUF3084 family)